MQIIDYSKNLRRFNNLELSILDALIKEVLLKDSIFNFLKEIDIVKNFDILWYYDNNGKALAGYQMCMNKTIYVSCGMFCGKDPADFFNNDGYDRFAFDRVLIMLSSIIHEAYHYYQHKHVYKAKYFFLQLPIIRNFSIEKEAYAISDYIDKLNLLEKFNQLRECLLKIKYNFQESYFFNKDEVKLREILLSQKLDPMRFWNFDCTISSLIANLS